MEPSKIGIIGGSGAMGQWFVRFFCDLGYTVLIADKNTSLTLIQCAKQCDVVLIAVPIVETCKVIEKVAPFINESGLLMDITSIKTQPLKAMLDNAKCSVIGTHPVFGPSVQSIRNQKVIICEGKGKEWQKWLVDLLEREGAHVKVSTPQEHDKMMSVIQGVIHFSTITISHVLRDMGIEVGESKRFSSPIYKLRMDMVGRILNQDPRLYADIEIENLYTITALEKYLESSKILFKHIKNKDKGGFVRYFEEGAEYLGEFKKEADEYSNYIIEQLVSKRNQNEK